MKNKFIYLILSFLSISLFISTKYYDFELLKLEFSSILNNSLLYFLIVVLLYCFYKNTKIDRNKQSKVLMFSSLFLTLMLLLLNSIDVSRNFHLVYETKTLMFLFICRFISLYFIIERLLYVLIMKLSSINFNKKDKCKERFEKHPVLYTFLILLILYLPYIVIFYPGTMNADSLYEINQYYGVIKWTSHHPIFPTFFYGICMKIGRFVIDDNFGLFLSNIIQLITCCYVVSFCINEVYNITNKKVRIFLILFFGLFPLWPINFYTCVKDVLFSVFFLLFVILTYKYSNSKFNIRDYILYFLSALFIILFRNNGIHVILISMVIIVFCIDKQLRKNFIKILFLSIVVSVVINKSFTLCYGISKGSVREILAIPLQQTSTYVVNHDLTKDEENTINKIVNINKIRENYDIDTVDFVKSNFNIFVSKEELKDYLLTWFNMFFKQPKTYFISTINSTYGYFYPTRTEYKDDVALLYISSSICNVQNFKLDFINSYNGIRNFIIDLIHFLRVIPIIGLLFNCGTYSFILFIDTIVLLIKKKNKVYLLVPMYLILLVCIASPVNALVRYMMPLMLTLPFMQFIMIKIINEK